MAENRGQADTNSLNSIRRHPEMRRDSKETGTTVCPIGLFNTTSNTNYLGKVYFNKDRMYLTIADGSKSNYGEF